MSLSELEALAKATLVNPHGGYPYELYMPYITAATPETTLQMIALIRQMGDALKEAKEAFTTNGDAILKDYYADYINRLGMSIDFKQCYAENIEDALNALKEFDK